MARAVRRSRPDPWQAGEGSIDTGDQGSASPAMIALSA